jgi:hypothetical protein
MWGSSIDSMTLNSATVAGFESVLVLWHITFFIAFNGNIKASNV